VSASKPTRGPGTPEHDSTFATGGLVTGPGNCDTIPAPFDPARETVIPAALAKDYGNVLVAKLNDPEVGA
jgi:hypothetical protein